MQRESASADLAAVLVIPARCAAAVSFNPSLGLQSSHLCALLLVVVPAKQLRIGDVCLAAAGMRNDVIGVVFRPRNDAFLVGLALRHAFRAAPILLAIDGDTLTLAEGAPVILSLQNRTLGLCIIKERLADDLIPNLNLCRALLPLIGKSLNVGI